MPARRTSWTRSRRCVATTSRAGSPRRWPRPVERRDRAAGTRRSLDRAAPASAGPEQPVRTVHPPVGYLHLVPGRRPPHALRLPPRDRSRSLGRRLPAARVAALRAGGPGAAHGRRLRAPRAPARRRRRRLHDPDALPRCAAVPASRVLGERHPGLSQHRVPRGARGARGGRDLRPLVSGARLAASVARRRVPLRLDVRRPQSGPPAGRRGAARRAAARRVGGDARPGAGDRPGAAMAVALGDRRHGAGRRRPGRTRLRGPGVDAAGAAVSRRDAARVGADGRRVAGAGGQGDPDPRAARAWARREDGGVRAGRPDPVDPSHLAPGRTARGRGAALARARWPPRRVPHVLAQDVVAGGSPRNVDRRRRDRRRAARGPAEVPGDRITAPVSRMMPDLFDTHAHLHFPDFAPDLPDVLARARAVGVRRFLTIGTDVATSRAAVALAAQEPDVWASVGIHPHDAEAADAAALEEIGRLAQAPRVVAVGEIGLDWFRNLAPRAAQEAAFRRQLALAREVGRPVLVHCREAHPDVLRILDEERAGERGGIMHCFSGDVAIARRCLDLGFLVSLAGPVTYPKARALPEVARWVPGDRLVIETDCPYLPPQAYRGKRNEPAYLALTAARVAELRGEALVELAARLTANACALLGVP